MTIQSEPLKVKLKKLSKTKQTILTNSLQLFNEQGFDSITTAIIAQRSGILEGTLWYHYNTKLDLSTTHIEIFNDSFQIHIENYQNNSPEQVINYFIEGIKIFWDYRYLFRDIVRKPDNEKNKDIILKIRTSANLAENTLQQGVAAAVKSGVLIMPEEDIADFTTSLFILGRYWLEYALVRYPNQDEEFYRTRNIELLFKFIMPYISQELKGVLLRDFK